MNVDKNKLFITFTALILGFAVGSIFQFIVLVNAGGLNRYLFIFATPLVIFARKNKHHLFPFFILFFTGVFLSDFVDFTLFITTYYPIFIVIYLYYVIVIYYIDKIRRPK